MGVATGGGDGREASKVETELVEREGDEGRRKRGNEEWGKGRQGEERVEEEGWGRERRRRKEDDGGRAIQEVGGGE